MKYLVPIFSGLAFEVSWCFIKFKISQFFSDEELFRVHKTKPQDNSLLNHIGPRLIDSLKLLHSNWLGKPLVMETLRFRKQLFQLFNNYTERNTNTVTL